MTGILVVGVIVTCRMNNVGGVSWQRARYCGGHTLGENEEAVEFHLLNSTLAGKGKVWKDSKSSSQVA